MKKGTLTRIPLLIFRNTFYYILQFSVEGNFYEQIIENYKNILKNYERV